MDIFLIALDTVKFDYFDNLQIKWITYYRNCILWHISDLQCSKHNHPTDKKKKGVLCLVFYILPLGSTSLLHQVTEHFSMENLSTFWLQVKPRLNSSKNAENGRSPVLVPLANSLQDHCKLAVSLYQRPKLVSAAIILQVLIIVPPFPRTPLSSNFCSLLLDLGYFTTISTKPAQFKLL